MLNISEVVVSEREQISQRFQSFKEIGFPKIRYTMAYFFGILFAVIVIIMFLPWTQNIQSRAKLMSLNPEDQEQVIPSIISGRIKKWYVREGQYVNEGDTLMLITEVKDKYLDPNLLKRTRQQIDAKEMSMSAYEIKINAIDDQIRLFKEIRELKLQEARNKVLQSEFKVEADSVGFETEQNNFKIAEIQYERQQRLFDQGLKSRTELEMSRVKLQDARNKMVSAQNKYLGSKNELINAIIYQSTVRNEYLEKIAKAESDRQSARSALMDARATVTKLENEYSNYSSRFDFYTILAPQNGYITKAYRSGVGETVKEGEPIVTFIPADLDKAVAMYVRAQDMPLIHEGGKVRFLFDGWPAIVFSGWPNLSYGTYGGIIVGYDRTSDTKGNFRVLVSPDPTDEPWPDLLRLGTGARGIALLNRVPVWYEIWRKLNGFPPDFYEQMESGGKESKGVKIKTFLK